MHTVFPNVIKLRYNISISNVFVQNKLNAEENIVERETRKCVIYQSFDRLRCRLRSS